MELERASCERVALSHAGRGRLSADIQRLCAPGGQALVYSEIRSATLSWPEQGHSILTTHDIQVHAEAYGAVDDCLDPGLRSKIKD